MFYVHHMACISPQRSFPNPDIDALVPSVNNQLRVIEPAYPGIPASMIRRMGKAVKIGVGAAMALLHDRDRPLGIIIGTANGGMEDCIKFLNQIIEYDEGMLAPGNFVQSTTNAIASQLGMLTANKAYNITHAHRGLAFENAMMDACMLVNEQPAGYFLLGGVDEISSYNYNIDYLDGWYKKHPASNLELYQSDSEGSLAGEGAAMFLVNSDSSGAIAQVKAIGMIHCDDEHEFAVRLTAFLHEHLNGESVDLLISGENGDRRLAGFYAVCESLMIDETGIVRFKHMSGEYPTASSMALWLACYFLSGHPIPGHMTKKKSGGSRLKNLLIYNNFKRGQHSLILVTGKGLN